MPLGGWWGDVYLCVKEDATAALGARAGGGVEIEHAVQNSGMYERKSEGPSATAPLCCVLFISQTHYCTVVQGPGEEQWRGMREME